MVANSRQVGGDHYKSNFQHWDYALAVGMQGLPYAITKYIARWRKKDGVLGLEKAQHYLLKLMESEGVRRVKHRAALMQFVQDNKLNYNEAKVFEDILEYFLGEEDRLTSAFDAISKLINDDKLKTKLQPAQGVVVPVDPTFLDDGDEWAR